MVLRRLFLILVATLLTGCAAGPALFGGTGHVSGIVTQRACGGAYRADQSPCRTTPVAGVTIKFRLNGSSDATSAMTNAAGQYGIDLRPGTYSVDVAMQPSRSALQPDGPTVPGFAGPKTITVTAGTTVTADFTRVIALM